jgi:hypothetical protein
LTLKMLLPGIHHGPDQALLSLHPNRGICISFHDAIPGKSDRCSCLPYRPYHCAYRPLSYIIPVLHPLQSILDSSPTIHSTLLQLCKCQLLVKVLNRSVRRCLELFEASPSSLIEKKTHLSQAQVAKPSQDVHLPDISDSIALGHCAPVSPCSAYNYLPTWCCRVPGSSAQQHLFVYLASTRK